MNVVHIGTADNRGGAARAAFQLHEGLLSHGHRSSMLVNQRFEDRPEIARIGFSRTLAGRAAHRGLLEAERLTGLQSLLQPLGRAFLTHPFLQNADVVQLHNLHGNYFPLRLLPKLSALAPVVWTLHDTWSLTGHCAYTYDCERWRAGCGRCPRLAEYPPIAIDTTALLWRAKHRAYKRTDLTVVAPSRWLAEMARQSPLFSGSEIHCIPYAVDLQTFRPLPRAETRHALGIGPGERVLMALVLPDAERKGSRFLEEALRHLQPVTVLAVGGGMLRVPPQTRLIEMGALDSRDLMNRCYVAADLFVLPTLADNLPVAVLESLASGTPVAAFAVGGVPDLVVAGETGCLARPGDAADLARSIERLLVAPEQLARLRETCRARAVAEHAPDVQVARYLAVYEQLVARRRAGARQVS